MGKLTTYERIKRMYEHREADRIPIFDSPWTATIKRWQREGMPEGMDYRDFFQLDHIATIEVDNSFQYPYKLIEETEDYIIYTSKWGGNPEGMEERQLHTGVSGLYGGG